MVNILGITGRKGSGKSTLAGRLFYARVVPTYCLSFAEPLKRLAVEYFGCPSAAVYGADELKRSMYALNGRTVRDVLQTVGVAWRDIDPTVWIRAAGRLVAKINESFPPNDPWLGVFDDCRFENEASWIHGQGGKVIRLIGRGDATDTHISETSIDSLPVDLEVNTSNLRPHELAAVVFRHLRTWGMLPHA